MRCPQVVLEARCAGEDLLLHEELAAGTQAEGLDRGQRHRPSLHTLRGPDTELGPQYGVRQVRMAEGELPLAMGGAGQPDEHKAARVQGQDAQGFRVLRRGLDIFDEQGIEVPPGCRPKSRLKPRKPLTKTQKMGRKSSRNLH